MTIVIKQHLLRAQVRMKHQLDNKKISDITFEVGDKVFFSKTSVICSIIIGL
jgi:hypothetical protein